MNLLLTTPLILLLFYYLKKNISNPQSRKTAVFLALFLIIIITVLSFKPVLKANLLNWDDEAYILKNETVRSLASYNIKNIFTNTVLQVYSPLTTLSFAVEYHFFEYNPFIYHLDNLLLHLANLGLIFWLVMLLGFPIFAAALATLLFAIHPMHVESVAWATERKDVLYSLFYLLSLCSYLRYLENKKIKTYSLTIVFGLLSMLSKPMALSLPLIFFLLDWFKKRSWSKEALFDKIPHFSYVVPLAWITYTLHARVPIKNISQALLIWIRSFVFYIKQFLLPFDLLPIYAVPNRISILDHSFFLPVIFFIFLIGYLIFKPKNRTLIFAFAFYFLSIFFLLRFDYGTDFNIVADRFMYLPSLGICIFLGFLGDHLITTSKIKVSIKNLVLAFLIILFSFFSYKTHSQCLVWKDSLTLWNDLIKHHKDTFANAYNSRGSYYMDHENQYSLALADYNKAIQIDPKLDTAYNNKGILYGKEKQYDLAIQEIRKAIQIDPQNESYYNNLGFILGEKGDYSEAKKMFLHAIKINPNQIEANKNLAQLYTLKGNFYKGLMLYHKIIQKYPNRYNVLYSLSDVYLNHKRYKMVTLIAKRVLSICQDANTLTDLGSIYASRNLNETALNFFEKSLKLDSNNAKTYFEAGSLAGNLGLLDQAIALWEKGLRIDPSNQKIKTNIIKAKNLLKK
ncbi:MAG: tetratricopeptide repeat protein [Candidatus Omnitrophica bacterium]|nr:tetratricopeptide repeat protein [Candidatus Omnitrophota bacterium]